MKANAKEDRTHSPAGLKAGVQPAFPALIQSGSTDTKQHKVTLRNITYHWRRQEGNVRMGGRSGPISYLTDHERFLEKSENLPTKREVSLRLAQEQRAERELLTSPRLQPEAAAQRGQTLTHAQREGWLWRAPPRYPGNS